MQIELTGIWGEVALSVPVCVIVSRVILFVLSSAPASL